jgi:hypothetical protein
VQYLLEYITKKSELHIEALLFALHLRVHLHLLGQQVPIGDAFGVAHDIEDLSGGFAGVSDAGIHAQGGTGKCADVEHSG